MMSMGHLHVTRSIDSINVLSMVSLGLRVTGSIDSIDVTVVTLLRCAVHGEYGPMCDWVNRQNQCYLV